MEKRGSEMEGECKEMNSRTRMSNRRRATAGREQQQEGSNSRKEITRRTGLTKINLFPLCPFQEHSFNALSSLFHSYSPSPISPYTFTVTLPSHNLSLSISLSFKAHT